MESLEYRRNPSAENRQANLAPLPALKELHAAFVRQTNEQDLAVFFAFCHLLTTDVGSSFLSKSGVDPEYKKANLYLGKMGGNRSQLVLDLKKIVEKGHPKEAVAIFSTFYEQAIQRGERAKLGAFYTPISYCVDALGQVANKEKLRTVYDPYCGAGAWLVSFLLTRQPNLFDLEKPPVYGTDIDRNAVFLTRFNLSLLLPNSVSTFLALIRQIRVADSLYPDKSDTATIRTYLEACDFVATNPPYGFAVNSNSTSFETRLSRIPDKEVFYYAIDRIRAALPKSKPALFLVPNTFLFNLGSKDFRNFLTEQHEVAVWDHTKSDIFQSANVRTALLVLKEKNQKRSLVAYSASFSERTKNLKELDFVEGRFKNGGTSGSQGEIWGDTVKLNDLFEVSQGLIPYDKYRGHTLEQIVNRVYHSSKKLGPDYRRELRGKDVSPFSVKWSGDLWIKYGEWLAAPRSKKFFTEPRVLIREITSSQSGRMNCAYTQAEFYNTPSIINVLARDNGKAGERQLKTLAVLLSSTPYASYHLANGPKASKGLFPKILVNDVRNLPLPRNFKDLDLSELYDRVANTVENGGEANDVAKLIDATVERLISKKHRKAA